MTEDGAICRLDPTLRLDAPSGACDDAGGAPDCPADLDYDLPSHAIAQTPLPQRDQARLLVDCGDGVSHRRVHELPDLLGAGDVVVVNDTRVLPARLRARRATGATAEVLLLAERGDGVWEALVRPARRLRDGEVLSLGPRSRRWPAGAQAGVQIGEDLGQGRRLVRLKTDGHTEADLLEEMGVMPLPPYISGDIADPERYQTVYARRARSAAAPTAGLHFTQALLRRLRDGGVKVVAVELEIGLDTFRPITAERLEDHVIHTERYRIPPTAAEAVSSARRVVAVGTTVVRALETHALTGQRQGRSGLFIRRPFDWRAVDLLMTNFHLPRSSLLCLLDAFVGRRWRDLYATALENRYRFLSFGDAMLVARAADSMRPQGRGSR